MRLTAEDVRILGLETARVAGHTLKVTALAPDADPITLVELRDHVAGGSTASLVSGTGWRHDGDGLAWDPTRSSTSTSTSASTRSATTFEAAVAELMEERLDRDRRCGRRPRRGRAIVLKVHHAMADGMAVRRIATALLWEVDAPPRVRRRRPCPSRRTATSSPTSRDCRRPSSASSHRRSPARRSPGASGPRGLRRSRRRISAAIGRLRDAFGTHLTVNDVVLGATAGGLRRWLLARDAPLHRMRVKVPVSLHRADERGDALGNDDSFFFVDLPLAEPDPVARLLAIARECTLRKARHDALELGTVLHIGGRSRCTGR